jgi:hypothetical protein
MKQPPLLWSPRPEASALFSARRLPPCSTSVLKTGRRDANSCAATQKFSAQSASTSNFQSAPSDSSSTRPRTTNKSQSSTTSWSLREPLHTSAVQVLAFGHPDAGVRAVAQEFATELSTLSTAQAGYCANLYAMASFSMPRAKTTEKQSSCSMSSTSSPPRTATDSHLPLVISSLHLRHFAACGRAVTSGSADLTDDHPLPCDEVQDMPM